MSTFLVIGIFGFGQLIHGQTTYDSDDCRSLKEVKRNIDKKRYRLFELYNLFRIKNPQALGYVRVNFDINSSGQIINYTVDSTSFTKPDFLPILKKELLTWDFGRVDDVSCITPIRYPFIFVASNLRTEYVHKHKLKMNPESDTLKKIVSNSLRKSFLQINKIIDKRFYSSPGVRGELKMLLQFDKRGRLEKSKVVQSSITNKKMQEKIISYIKLWKIKGLNSQNQSLRIVYKYTYEVKK